MHKPRKPTAPLKIECLTPNNCAMQRGWWRAFCTKCIASRLPGDGLIYEVPRGARATVNKQRT